MLQTKPADEAGIYGGAPVSREDRERLGGHRGMALWFTGLPGAGKSSVAEAVEQALHSAGHRTFILDGDNVRRGLNNDLGFSGTDRSENIRRTGEVARLFVEAGVVTLCAFISPFRADRERVRSLFGAGDFIEIYCCCPPEICEQRYKKGFYARARAGMLPEFTGVSSPYETPLNPELVLDTHALTVQECAERVLKHLRGEGVMADRRQRV